MSEEICKAIHGAILEAIPDARAEVAGAGGHYAIRVVSATFEGKGLLDKQRLVLSAIKHLMSGENAPVHAIDELQTLTP